MRIRSLHIDGFGLFREAKFDDISAGLIIVSGPNETGKSTLLHFLRGILFGFELDARSARCHPPLNGGPWGGRIVLDTDEGTYIVERFAEPTSFEVIRPDGTKGSTDDLHWMLGGLDEATFQNVFAFSLSELEDFSSLSADAIGERLFAAGLVGAGRSARSGAGELSDRIEEIFSLEGNDHAIGRLRDDYREINNDVTRARLSAEAYPRRQAEAEALDGEARRLEHELEHTRETVQRYEALQAIWPDHVAATEAQEELDGLPDLSAPVDEPELRLDRATTGARIAVNRLDEVGRKAALSAQRLDRAKSNETFDALDDEIQSLHEELAADQARADRRAEVERALLTQEHELAEELSILGPEWDRTRLQTFDISIPAADEVRQWARQLVDSEEDTRRIDGELAAVDDLVTHANRDVDRLRDHLDGAASLPEGEKIDKAHDALRRLRSAVSDAEHTDSEAASARERLERVEKAEVTNPSSAERAVALAQPALFTIALALVAATVFCLLTDRTSTAMLAGIGALVAAGIGLLTPTRHLDRSAADADALRDARRDVEKSDELHAAALEAVAILAGRVDLPAMPVPTPASIDRRESELLEQHDARREADRIAAAHDDAAAVALDAQRHSHEIRGRRDVLAARRSEIDTLWSTWKAERQVPELLSPEGVTDFFTTVKRARSTQRRVELLEIELATIRDRTSSFADRANRLLKQTSGSAETAPAEGATLRSAVRRLHDDAQTNREQQALFARARIEHDEIERDVLEARAASEAADHARRSVLSELGASDESEFRSNIGIARRRADLADEVKQRRRVITAALGEGEGAKVGFGELEEGDLASWDLRRIEELTRLDRLQLQFEDAIRRHQDAKQNLAQIGASTELADLLLRREEVRSRIVDAVQEWERLTLAHALLTRALSTFEQDHQPAVLERAQEMFAEVTDGRYLRLVLGDAGIEVVDARDRRLDCSRLSRGTAEQLYLCIRFALAVELGGHTRVPLVLDDVLVNFDPSRTLAMARVIARLADQLQILVFTCHPQTEDLLRHLQPEAQVIALPDPIAGRPER